MGKPFLGLTVRIILYWKMNDRINILKLYCLFKSTKVHFLQNSSFVSWGVAADQKQGKMRSNHLTTYSCGLCINASVFLFQKAISKGTVTRQCMKGISCTLHGADTYRAWCCDQPFCNHSTILRPDGLFVTFLLLAVVLQCWLMADS